MAKPTRSKNERPDRKIIMAIDIGTVGTAIAWKPSSDRDLTSIRAHSSWPASFSSIGLEHPNTSKTPARFAYACDNNGSIPRNLWGAEIGPEHVSISYIKLAFDRPVQETPFNQTRSDFIAMWQLDEYEDGGLGRLQTIEQARDVLIDYLTFLGQRIAPVFEGQMTGLNTEEMAPIEVWITVPNNWSAKGKKAMKEAVEAAGFVTRDIDSVRTITEPEAVIISKFDLDSTSKYERTTVLVIDCGGGTIDVSTYEIETVESVTRLNECVLGDSAKIGSVFVDCEFIAWMKRTFKKHYQGLPRRAIGPGSSFMREFELCKQKFGEEGTVDRMWEVTLEMPNAGKSDHYDPVHKKVMFHSTDMQMFFGRIIAGLRGLLDEQWAQLHMTPGATVNKVLVSGGFGQSAYIQLFIKDWVGRGFPQETNRPKIIFPPNDDIAVVKGAIIRGYQEIGFHTRVCHRWFGFRTYMPSGGSVTDLQALPQTLTNDMTTEKMYWALERGMRLTEGSPITKTYSLYIKDDGCHTFELALYSSIVKQPPISFSSGGVETVGSFDFNIPDLWSAGVHIQKVQIGRHTYRLIEVEMLRRAPGSSQVQL